MSEADDQNDLQEKIQELCDLESGLTDWEMDFLDSVSEQSFPITEKQAGVIDKIYYRLLG